MAEKKQSPSVTTPLVFVPALAAGLGLGHLRRALRLREAAGERGFLLVPREHRRPGLESLLAGLPRESVLDDPALIPAGACVVFDSRATDRALFRSLADRVFTVALDEGGGARPRCHYLIDTLPMILRRESPNIRALPVAPPAAVTASGGRFPPKKILLSFGGEDPADATSILLGFLLSRGVFDAASITVVEGPLFRRHDWPAGVGVIRGCPGLDAIVGGYDLLFTHYGLTAYEALLRGVPVILLNPGTYHRRLARRDEIPEIGVGRPDGRALARLLRAPEILSSAVARFVRRQAGAPTLEETVTALSPQAAPACPVCGRPGGRALDRFPDRTYFRCRGCGIIRLVFWGARRTYTNDYFSSEYRNQYGKTYIDDFDHIRSIGERRLDVIENIRRRSQPAAGGARPAVLLDVGAAYGPFLAAARDRGYDARGFEISPEAAAHVSRSLGLPCLAGDFETEPIGVRLAEKSFDIISMWYVLEHFVPTGEALRKANRLLAPGGVLALGTPSAAGVSYRKNRRRFLAQSPVDHFTVWSPRAARAALARFGFRVRRTVITGHHPERFCAGGGKGVLRRLFSGVSRLFRLGDTFEAYAVKDRECD